MTPPLNPAAGHGAAGGIELAALYDTLMRWNPDTRKVEPRTAASMLPNVDSTQWTLKLRPGIKFSDGTDYDANTVKFNVERSLAPSSGSGVKPILQTFLASTTVVDPLTVTFTLKQPWTGFSFLFTGALGLVASPAAIQKAGDNFNTSPGDAGAGPFVLSSFKPGESVVFKRNPHYWDGSVYLDQVTFELFNGAGATYLGLKTGILQAGLLRDPATIEMARSANFSMLTTPIAAGNMALFNSGAPTRLQGRRARPGVHWTTRRQAGRVLRRRRWIPGSAEQSRPPSTPTRSTSGSIMAKPGWAPPCSPPTFPAHRMWPALNTTGRRPAISFTKR